MNKKLIVFLAGIFCLAALSYAEPWICAHKGTIPTQFNITKERCDSDGDGTVTLQDIKAMLNCRKKYDITCRDAYEKEKAAKKSGNNEKYEKWKKIATSNCLWQGNIYNYASGCARKFGLFAKKNIEKLGKNKEETLDRITSGKYNNALFGNDQTVCRACRNSYAILKEFYEEIPKKDRENMNLNNPDLRKYFETNHKLFGYKPDKGICTKKGFTPYEYDKETGKITKVVGITCTKEDRISRFCAKHSVENQIKAREVADKAHAKALEYCSKYQNCKNASGSNCERYKTISKNQREFALSRHIIANRLHKLCEIGTQVPVPTIPECN